MNTDFRLSIGIFEHPKVRKLKRQLGAEGVLGYLCLLRFTAQNKPDGDLTGMECDDIALAADYDDDPCQFLDVLTALRLIDRDADGLRIHDWAEHNPYAATAPARSEKAKKAAEVRWGRSSNAQPVPKDTPGIPEQCPEHDLALPVASSSNAPSPYPSPNPSEERPPIPPEPAETTKPRQEPKVSLQEQRFDVFWKAYPNKTHRGEAIKAWSKIRPTEEHLGVMLTAIAWQRDTPKWKKDRGALIPNPATWLNAQGWRDEPEEGARAAPEPPPRFKAYDAAADFANEFGNAPRSAA